MLENRFAYRRALCCSGVSSGCGTVKRPQYGEPRENHAVGSCGLEASVDAVSGAWLLINPWELIEHTLFLYFWFI